MTLRRALLFSFWLLTALPCSAQTLVQSATSWFIDPLAVHVATLPKPVVAGDFLIAFTRNCSQAAPGVPFRDWQGNVWKPTDGYLDRWYVESAKGGALTLSFSYYTPNYCQPIVAEFSGSWTLDVVSHPLYTDDTTSGTSYPITPSEPGELIIGFGVDNASQCKCNEPLIQPGDGWTFAALNMPMYMEYQIAPTTAPIAATDKHAVQVDTIIAVAAFRRLG